jgi:hypothetical protein
MNGLHEVEDNLHAGFVSFWAIQNKVVPPVNFKFLDEGRPELF